MPAATSVKNPSAMHMLAIKSSIRSTTAKGICVSGNSGPKKLQLSAERKKALAIAARMNKGPRKAHRSNQACTTIPMWERRKKKFTMSNAMILPTIINVRCRFAGLLSACTASQETGWCNWLQKNWWSSTYASWALLMAGRAKNMQKNAGSKEKNLNNLISP